jgi:tRNA A-37 threonylcarbamoyl transferase component Bud32
MLVEDAATYTGGGVVSTLADKGHQAPERIGDYRIVRQLGAGGFGAVYEGVHVTLGRRAAIKLLHAELSSNPEMAVRFVNEARAASIIRHAGIVDVSDIGQLPSGAVFIIMEFLEGTTLRAHLRSGDGRLPLLPTLQLGQQIAAALAAAHSKGVVHRDLKPDNVMLLPDPLVPGGLRTKLVDFGIAKLGEEHSIPQQPKTRTGLLMGTPAYMSPEQCRGAGLVEDRSDVYSLGVILYQMLVGRRPFEGEGDGEIIGQHLFTEPRPLREIDPSLDRQATDLIHRMLRKDPKDRPTAVEVAEALLQGMQAQGPTLAVSQKPGDLATLTPTPTVSGTAAGRRGLGGPVIVGGLLVVAAAVFFTLGPGRPSSAVQTPPPATPAVVAANIPAPLPSSAPPAAAPPATPPPAGADNDGPAAHREGPKAKGSRSRPGADERARGRFGKAEPTPAGPTTAPAPAEPPSPPPAVSSPPPPAAPPAGSDTQVKATVDAAKVDYAFGRYASALSLARTVPQDRVAGRIIGAAACRLGDLAQASDAHKGAAAAERSYIETECQKVGVQLVNGRFSKAAAPSP